MNALFQLESTGMLNIIYLPLHFARFVLASTNAVVGTSFTILVATRGLRMKKMTLSQWFLTGFLMKMDPLVQGLETFCFQWANFDVKRLHQPVSSVVKRTLSMREVWGSISGPVKSALCCQWLANVETLLRSCVVWVLSPYPRKWTSPLVTRFGVMRRV